MNKVLIISPHPDDEVLGCCGTILKHAQAGDQVGWLICTTASAEVGYGKEYVQNREREIEQVARALGFKTVDRFDFPTTTLDQVPVRELVAEFKRVLETRNPEVLYLPYRGDIHTDHKAVFDAVASCSKWFRQKSIRSVLCYEVLSETEFAINPDLPGFKPNVFVDISPFIQRKLEIMNIYTSEIGQFPFPRSERAIRALAELRGAQSGCEAAEAFILLREYR